jgi:phosphatidylserine/phosphatidylglycerophosphate/cardiolipin synthase-like enzyme
VKINIFYEKKSGNFDKNIKFYKTKSKLHTKIAIFDKDTVYYGSANWKKKSFKENYEVINISNNKNKVKKFIKFFIKLKENN